MPPTATYLYCVVKAAAKPAVPAAIAGLPGASRPTAVPLERSLWLVVADVPLERYGPEALESSLRDLPWVSRAAMAHESIVESFTARRGATVVPMKLFTMFSSIERAIIEMKSRRREIAAVMKRIAGCEEWGVRLMRNAGQPQRPRVVQDRGPSGTAFLAAKKRARDESRLAAAAAAGAAEDVYTALAELARAATRRSDAPDNVATPPLLDAAFLVPTARRAVFRSAVKRLARTSAKAGADVTLTGPWPAYNFIAAGSLA